MSYPISHLDGCDDEAIVRLKKAGVRTTERLLALAGTANGRRALAERTGLDPAQLLAFANMADRMRLPGMGKEYASLMQAAGVKTVRELKYRNPARLAKAMAEANAKRKLVRVLPSEQAIERWVDAAKTLNIKISY
ncbi:MAG TPA: DUF4332 domain-containing protein [Xanthobacteraceae bacterium]|nr:DUF4332 domain-containing protein [Xanthobacteraceae bacterium]